MADSIRRMQLAPLAGFPDRVLQHDGDTDVCGTFTPEDDSQIHIVVGARVSEERLRRLAARHHLEPEALFAFTHGDRDAFGV